MSFLSETITNIRENTDEPADSAKFTDARLVSLISRAFGHVFTDINRISKHKTVVRYDLSILPNVSIYALPPTMKRIVDIQRVDSSGNIVQRYEPSSSLNPAWPGFAFEGSNLVFMNGYTPTESYTLRIMYNPTGFVDLCTGAVTTITNGTTSASVVVNGSPTTGTLDLRENAYAGHVFRMLTCGGTGAGMVIDRIITAYDPQTQTFTVSPAYASGAVPATPATYEIVPLAFDEMAEVVGLYVSRSIIQLSGDHKRYSLTNLAYKQAIRDIRLDLAHYDGISGLVFPTVSARSGNRTRNAWNRLDSPTGGL